MNDLRGSSRVLHAELALPPYLTSNAVHIFFKLPFPLRQQQKMSLFAIITVWHMRIEKNR